MRTSSISRFVLALVALLPLHTGTAAARFDTQAIERLTSAKGQLNEQEGTFKVSAPRTDLYRFAPPARV